MEGMELCRDSNSLSAMMCCYQERESDILSGLLLGEHDRFALFRWHTA